MLRQRRGQPAVRARFSRSSVFTFMLTEIVLQALGQMNAPGTRAQRRDADKPRHLRSLLMTMPPGMPVAEQHILRARAQGAVLLAWDMLGWTGAVNPPRVLANLDEATATQIVWLHNEVTERLQGDVGALMELIGRVRPEVAAGPSLRVASIDVGGGTTDLMVSTYVAQGEAILPRQEFRESFKIAGDDVLERVITAVALPAFAVALRAAGVADPRALLDDLMGGAPGAREGAWRSPAAARWLDALGWRRRAAVLTPRALLSRSGRWTRVVEIVPLERTQSLGVAQGPVQRRLGLATVRVWVSGAKAVVRDLDEDVAVDLYAREARHAAVSRRLADRDQWMRPEELARFEQRTREVAATEVGRRELARAGVVGGAVVGEESGAHVPAVRGEEER